MITKREWIMIAIGLILIIGIITAQSYRFYQTDQELIQVKSNYEDLEMEFHNESVKLEIKIKELNTVTKERDDIQILYAVDELYISELEKRYIKLFSYAQVAEAILTANGIDFLMVEGGLDTESLKGE